MKNGLSAYENLILNTNEELFSSGRNIFLHGQVDSAVAIPLCLLGGSKLAAPLTTKMSKLMLQEIIYSLTGTTAQISMESCNVFFQQGRVCQEAVFYVQCSCEGKKKQKNKTIILSHI